MTAVVRGRLRNPADAPVRGERVDQVLRVGDLLVEQILSAAPDHPVEFVQDHDEWVVVLGGAAVLDVDGERLELGPGDWVLLPSGAPHRLLDNDPGTSWLAVHLPRSSRGRAEPASSPTTSGRAKPA
ncbi:MAG: cupin domain-containing protein [Actinobacteria bacterium]|nr:cupin domain-containing protein [Actinomycetota bacterium]